MVLIVTTEDSGLDRYSQEIGRRIRGKKIETRRYFSLGESYCFAKLLRGLDDAVHLPNQHFARYAFLLKKPFVVTVHDLARICLDFSRERLEERIGLRLDITGLKRANHIIAVSQYTKNDIIKYLGISGKKISVIYNGIDHHIFRPTKGNPFPHLYLLYVGSERPRKNLGRLLQAFAKVKMEFAHLKLVKVGPPGRSKGFRRKLIRQIEDLGLRDEVIIVDYVPKAELPNYYSSAAALVYPSLYEGFGFPPLEAMACGCPVITSNTSSLPEIVGDAAIMVNPYDVDELAKAIAEVLTDSRLREQLVEKGLAQAKRFSWQKATEETMGVYKKLEAGIH